MSGRPPVHGRPISFASAGQPLREQEPVTRFAHAGSSGQARSVTGIVSPPIGTWSVVSVKAFGRSAAKLATNVSGFARRPVVNTVLPAASVVGLPSPAPLGWIA